MGRWWNQNERDVDDALWVGYRFPFTAELREQVSAIIRQNLPANVQFDESMLEWEPHCAMLYKGQGLSEWYKRKVGQYGPLPDGQERKITPCVIHGIFISTRSVKKELLLEHVLMHVTVDNHHQYVILRNGSKETRLHIKQKCMSGKLGSEIVPTASLYVPWEPYIHYY